MRRLIPCLLVALLLIPSLTSQSLWWDEGISLHLASLPWLEIIRDRADNIHPPLYFLLLKIWTMLVGRSPFAARYLSVLPMILLPAAIYRFCRKCWGWQTGRATAFLSALAPPFIIYGQEVRAYAFLPLFWVLLLDLSWSTSNTRRWRIRAGALIVLEAVFILFHYTGLIAVALVDLLLLHNSLHSDSKGRARTLRRIAVVSTAGVAVFLLPWLFQVARLGFQGISGQAGLSNALAEAVPSRYVVVLLAVFHGFGLPQVLSNPGLMRPLVATGIVMLGGLSVMIWHSRSRRPTLRMIVVWLLPFAVAPVIWSLSPQAHPRYLLPFVLPGWLLVGIIVGTVEVPRAVRCGLLASILVMSLLGLHAYFEDPVYARSDIRAVAGYLRRHAQAGDVVFVPHTDWSLLQYELGKVEPIMIPDPSEDTKVFETMRDAVNPGYHVYLVDYERGAIDPRGQVRAHLVSAGHLVGRRTFHGVFLERYSLSRPVKALACDNVGHCVNDVPLCLGGAAVGDAPVSGGAAAVRLCWRGRASSSLSAAMRLSAPSDALIASHDAPLIDERVRPTNLWEGEATSTYHVVPLPVGMSPIPHRLTLGLYETESVDEGVTWSTETGSSSSIVLGSVKPVVAPWTSHSLYGLPCPPQKPSAHFDEGVEIIGARIDREQLYVGQRFFATVHWSVTGVRSSSLDAQLVLIKGGRDLAQTAVGSGLESLPSGRPLVEHVSLRVPAEVGPGRASVVLNVEGQVVPLGTIEVLSGEHSFTAPSVLNEIDAQLPGVGTLVGFNRSPEALIVSGQPLTLTLFWRATGDSHDADLTVFTHLVTDEGKIVAQHDGQPVDGTRPTPSWLDGEFITDSHVLRWVDTYQGPAKLRVGMYQPATGQRFIWTSGRDYLELPGTLRVKRKVED